MPISEEPGEVSRGRPLALTHGGGMVTHQPCNSLADRPLGPTPGTDCRGLARVQQGHQVFKKRKKERKMERGRGRKRRDRGKERHKRKK